MRDVYGFEIERSSYGPRGAIAPPERSAAGNLVLHVGREQVTGLGWFKVAHVVLTPDEARDFTASITELMADG